MARQEKREAVLRSLEGLLKTGGWQQRAWAGCQCGCQPGGGGGDGSSANQVGQGLCVCAGSRRAWALHTEPACAGSEGAAKAGGRCAVWLKLCMAKAAQVERQRVQWLAHG